MRLPPHDNMRNDSATLCAEQFCVPSERSLDLLDGTPESPQVHCHTYRKTLMSTKDSEIAQCTTNQVEMKPSSPAMAPEPSCIPHHTRQGASLPLLNSRDSLRHPSLIEEYQFQHSNSRKAPCTPNHLEMRADPTVSTEAVC